MYLLTPHSPLYCTTCVKLHNLVAEGAVVAVRIPRRLANIGKIPVKRDLVHQVHVVEPHREVGGVNVGGEREGEGVVADGGALFRSARQEIQDVVVARR